MNKLKSSFRDPSGFLFEYNNILYRQINLIYKENYDLLISSGLYEVLIKDQLLIKHIEVQLEIASDIQRYKIIQPENIPIISYPYEWCYSQLKDAALLTLKIQLIALKYGLILKDASAYNVQFFRGKPIFIDSLSFEKYLEGTPWVAYRQFCQHFLAPLALMCLKDIRLNQLLKTYLDGIPLDLTANLLPFSSRFNIHLYSHVFLHSYKQKKYADQSQNKPQPNLSKMGLLGIIDSLQTCINNLKLNKIKTQWAEYYSETNYSAYSFDQKKQIVNKFINLIRPKTLLDIGSNTGIFSRIASQNEISTISIDNDPIAIEKNYYENKKTGEKNILPLVIDITNPSPAIGWANEERNSIKERVQVDVILALAVVHHMVISNHLSYKQIAEFFSRMCRYLIIEFIPLIDSQVQYLLINKDINFDFLNQNFFEIEFSNYFFIEKRESINDSERSIYKMKNICLHF